MFNKTSLDKQLLSLALFSYSRVLLFGCLLCSSRIAKEAEVSSVACIDEEHQCDLSVWHSCLQKEYELSLSDGGADGCVALALTAQSARPGFSQVLL